MGCVVCRLCFPSPSGLFRPVSLFAAHDRRCTTTPHHTAPHHTTLHYTTLHYTTLHYTTLHYTTLQDFIHNPCSVQLTQCVVFAEYYMAEQLPARQSALAVTLLPLRFHVVCWDPIYDMEALIPVTGEVGLCSHTFRILMTNVPLSETNSLVTPFTH